MRAKCGFVSCVIAASSPQSSSVQLKREEVSETQQSDNGLHYQVEEHESDPEDPVVRCRLRSRRVTPRLRRLVDLWSVLLARLLKHRTEPAGYVERVSSDVSHCCE